MAVFRVVTLSCSVVEYIRPCKSFSRIKYFYVLPIMHKSHLCSLYKFRVQLVIGVSGLILFSSHIFTLLSIFWKWSERFSLTVVFQAVFLGSPPSNMTFCDAIFLGCLTDEFLSFSGERCQENLNTYISLLRQQNS